MEKCPDRRFDPGMRRTRDLFMEVLRQARFADPRFTDDQRHLVFAIAVRIITLRIITLDSESVCTDSVVNRGSKLIAAHTLVIEGESGE